MNIQFRRYKLLEDFKRVCSFLDSNYNLETLNGYLLKPFYEYAHTHDEFNHKLSHRIGLWESGEELVGIVSYEMNIGECFISIKEGYNHLLQGMINYGEAELSEVTKDQKTLSIWTTENEFEKNSILEKNGYMVEYREPITIFEYKKEFPLVKLPSGFSIISLEDENDFEKINACLWKGFDHGATPDKNIDGSILKQSGPNFRKDLTTVIKSPDGEYACFAGMWIEEGHKYAYLEPLATVPQYRRLGLATAALVEGMKKTKALGAEYCFGGSGDFYNKLGFRTINHRIKWVKSVPKG